MSELPLDDLDMRVLLWDAALCWYFLLLLPECFDLPPLLCLYLPLATEDGASW